MVDIHSHILPCLDDGSRSVEMSLEMLRESKRQGVECVIATSHCYTEKEEDLDVFLEERNKSYEALKKAMDKSGDEFPKIVLGAELHLRNYEIDKYQRLEELCIQGTNYLLVEMPYRHWRSGLFDILYNMTIKGIRPIMAHIERFFDHQKDFGNFMELDLLYQINADSMLEAEYKKIIPYLFNNGMVQFVGSDMHNLDARPTRIGEAFKKIEGIYGGECVDYIIENSQKLLNNEAIHSSGFKKKSLFDRVMKK